MGFVMRVPYTVIITAESKSTYRGVYAHVSVCMRTCVCVSVCVSLRWIWNPVDSSHTGGCLVMSLHVPLDHTAHVLVPEERQTHTHTLLSASAGAALHA